ncbi:ankyrin repeat-containing protein At2g01680-like isoform X2 [Cryptomeria japonica]|uniref:ankyrin repeat-containing protein At2g01680-like isoform X2 n=1 Tax=Cryptomeria japonica TaxID=3369 RepID=UPI0027DAAED4|nr:ankyrin repeat-containing protein At2g01680-like isoform X2 [Cryptomeria japonica]
MLITADAELAGIRNNKGESPLFTATAYGRWNSLKLLLLINRDPRCYARFDGQTCLHHALFYQKEEAARTLIKKAPQLCKLADYFLGRTPLHMAALYGCSKTIVHKLLQCDTSSAFTKDKIKQQTALHLAAQQGHADIVRCILGFAEDC